MARPKSDITKQKVTLRLHPEILGIADEIAKFEGKSRTGFIESLIRERIMTYKNVLLNKEQKEVSNH